MVMRDLWYKNAIIYSIDVKTFADGNGDGIGDFIGLSSRLDYLAGLGVTCLWLLPFYPSMNRDNGYDVTDYYTVDPKLGSLGDFVHFTHLAADRGIRVIIDLVVNHTSKDHPWFKAACSAAESPYHDFYFWSKKRPKKMNEGAVFPGVQNTTWTYDRKARAYYFHRFYDHQPDLNIANIAVREEICKIMGFWLQLGVAGFRMDAAPFVFELRGAPVDGQDPYGYLNEFRDFLTWRRSDAVLLAEANVEPDKLMEYVLGGDRMHMLFNFIVNQWLFLAFAKGEAAPLIDALRRLPELPELCQWATFLRNHDEIDLGRLTDDERAEVFRRMGPEPTMQIYRRGLRRRLAPMLDGDPVRIGLAFSCLFSLPGTPVIWYGDEIGMGEDLSLLERNSVRTPMQWSAESNAGFSTAPAERLIRPVITEGPFGYPRVNVAAQLPEKCSILNLTVDLIRARKQHPELGRGTWQLIPTDNPAVVALLSTWQDHALLTIHNLSDRPSTVAIDPLPGDHHGPFVDVVSDRHYPPLEDEFRQLPIAGYGFRWIRVGSSPI